MDIIHADENLAELGFVRDLEKFDAEISIATDAPLQALSWSLTVPDDAWAARPILEGHYIYIPDAEWGGPVERVRHSTAQKLVTVEGPTWRGMLYRKIVEPGTGDEYLEIDSEANAALNTIIGVSMGSLFTVSEADSGIAVLISLRYANMLLGIEKMLSDAGATLVLAYDQTTQSVLVSAEAVTDYSATVDLSQDYGVDMISTSGRIDGYNHIVALGAGELLDRDVVHRYRLADGTITSTPPAWAGTDADRATVYDYGNAETVDALIEGADKKLREYAPDQSVEMDPGDADLSFRLGDIVGARDRLTGLAATATVTGQILTIDASGVRIDTKVG